jgi:hypothetical protein
LLAPTLSPGSLARAAGHPCHALLYSKRFVMPFDQTDMIYYRRRIEVTRVQAAQAKCPSARRAHEELLRLYLESLGDPQRGETVLPASAAWPAPVAADQETADDIHTA